MKTAAADPRPVLNLCLLAVATAGLVAYLAARGVGRTDWAAWLPLAGTLPVLAAVLVDSLMSLLRRKIGLDLIALISIGGAIMLGEYVATAVIAIMLSGGRVLEDYAAGRVSRGNVCAPRARAPIGQPLSGRHAEDRFPRRHCRRRPLACTDRLCQSMDRSVPG